jgi:hypothetical protein
LGLLPYFEFDFAHEFHYVSCFVLLLSCLNVHVVQIGWASSLAAAVQGKNYIDIRFRHGNRKEDIYVDCNKNFEAVFLYFSRALKLYHSEQSHFHFVMYCQVFIAEY